jgi:hypothetical protein
MRLSCAALYDSVTIRQSGILTVIRSYCITLLLTFKRAFRFFVGGLAPQISINEPHFIELKCLGKPAQGLTAGESRSGID